MGSSISVSFSWQKPQIWISCVKILLLTFLSDSHEKWAKTSSNIELFYFSPKFAGVAKENLEENRLMVSKKSWEKFLAFAAPGLKCDPIWRLGFLPNQRNSLIIYVRKPGAYLGFWKIRKIENSMSKSFWWWPMNLQAINLSKKYAQIAPHQARNLACVFTPL